MVLCVVVFVDEGKAGTRHGIFYAELLAEDFDEGCFSCAEIAVEGEDFLGGEGMEQLFRGVGKFGFGLYDEMKSCHRFSQISTDYFPERIANLFSFFEIIGSNYQNRFSFASVFLRIIPSSAWDKLERIPIFG